MGMRSGKALPLALIALVLVVAGAMYLVGQNVGSHGSVNVGGQPISYQAYGSTGANGNPSGSGYACQASGVATNTLQFAAKNTLDATGAEFGAATIAVADANGNILNTGTGTAASGTQTYTSITIPCGANYPVPAYAYALSSTSLSFGAGGMVVLNPSTQAQYIIPTMNSSDMTLLSETSGYGADNGTNTSGVMYTTSHTMAAGASYNGIIALTANVTAGQIGATTTWAIGYGNPAYYGVNSLNLQGGFTKQPCPQWANALSAVVCFSRPSITSMIGTQNIPYTVSAVAATGSNNFTVYFIGDGFFGDTNSKISQGAFNLGNTQMVRTYGKFTFYAA